MKLSVLRIEQASKAALDRVKAMVLKVDEHEKKLISHRKLHTTTKDILQSQKDQITTIITKVGNLTIVREKKK